MTTAPDHIYVGMAKFHFYREHFDFGTFPAYRSDFGGKSHFRFFVGGLIMTPDQLADFLEEEYIQQNESGIRAATSRYATLRALEG